MLQTDPIVEKMIEYLDIPMHTLVTDFIVAIGYDAY